MQLGTQIDRTDSDGDGLNDGIEVIELGTNPLDIDTDGDHLSDGVEVRGFVDDVARQWYLNPVEADTNHDGTADTLECFDLKDVEDRNGRTVLMPARAHNVPTPMAMARPTCSIKTTMAMVSGSIDLAGQRWVVGKRPAPTVRCWALVSELCSFN
jgi:hypothetical protein